MVIIKAILRERDVKMELIIKALFSEDTGN